MFSCGASVKNDFVCQFISGLSGALQAVAPLSCLTFQFESAGVDNQTNVFVEFATAGHDTPKFPELLQTIAEVSREVSADLLFDLQFRGAPVRDEEVVEAMEAANDSTEDFHIADLA